MSPTLRYYQEEALKAIFDYWSENDGNPLIDMATGCHAAGTEILMFDGTTKPVELIVANDNLMGPDSTPRRVLRTVTGQEMLYRVTPVKGEPFVVNEGHILSLKTTNEGKKATRHPGCHVPGGRIENTKLSEWLGKSKSWKHVRKLWRAGVSFPANDNKLSVPPYIAGVMLGDGSLTYQPAITNMDPEILDEVCEYVESLGVGLRIVQKPDNKAWGVFFPDDQSRRSVPNRFTALLRDAGLWGQSCAEKHIPHSYKVGSRKTRLEVLAGLIDTDGHLSNGTGFDFIAKSERMSKDVAFVARSLGFAAYVTECLKSSQTGFVGTYFRVSISGDVDEIPVRLPRKKAEKRRQIKSPLVTGFSVEPVGVGSYHGFALDGDHLYLTGDFTVHHNTGKGLTLASLTERLITGWPTLRVMCVTHVVELVSQDLSELLSIWPFAPVGLNAASLNRRDCHAQITFAQLQTVWNKADEIGHIDVLEIDEVHLVPADANTMYGKLIAALLAINPDMKIVGFTATPYRLDSGRLDEGDDKLFDKVVYTYGIGQGIADGYLTPLSSKGMKTGFDLSGVGTLGGDYKKGALQTAVDKEEVTRAAVAEAVAYGQDKRTALFFCSGVEHALHVRDEVRRLGRTCETITGDLKITPKSERRRILQAFKSGEIWGVTNDAVLTTGTNVPGIDMIADLAPTKSTSRFVQKAGRGTRPVYAPGFDLDTVEGRLAAIAAGPKPTCLYLDYAKNVSYHGPVDLAQPRKPGKGGEQPVKLCPQCEELLPISIMVCSCCGYEFPPTEDVKITQRAATVPILSTEAPAYHPVHSRTFAYHDKIGGTPSVKVTYGTDAGRCAEWVCPQHTGFAKNKSDRYWSLHKGALPFPKSVDEFLDRAGELRVTSEVQIRFGGKYPEILAHHAGEAMGEVPAPANGNLAMLGRPTRRLGGATTSNWADIEHDIPFFRSDI